MIISETTCLESLLVLRFVFSVFIFSLLVYFLLMDDILFGMVVLTGLFDEEFQVKGTFIDYVRVKLKSFKRNDKH